MPAEWEPHASTWIAWPHNRSDWPGKFSPIPWVFAEIIRHLSRRELVNLVVENREAERQAGAMLSRANVEHTNLRFHHWHTNRCWTRDCGAIVVYKTGQLEGRTRSKPSRVALDWLFNAWAKYADWKLDNRFASRMARALELPCEQPTSSPSAASPGSRLVLEGGAIDVNGCGLLLATVECLLSTTLQTRNPGCTRLQLEDAFARYLGIEKVIWLPHGIVGDDTHGHIDDIARFVSADTVVAAVESKSADENYGPLKENLRYLRAATDQNGHPLRVVELPMPAPVVFGGRRLPASYANFYIANGVVLVPTFDDPNDRPALNILAELFPDRRVTGIYCGDLIWGLGAIHCMTQQEPQ